MYVYDSSRFGNYGDRWTLAADSTMEHLASHPSSRPQLTFLASFANTRFVNTSQHLTCFDGGSFLLGGQVFDKKEYIDFGLGPYFPFRFLNQSLLLCTVHGGYRQHCPVDQRRADLGAVDSSC